MAAAGHADDAGVVHPVRGYHVDRRGTGLLSGPALLLLLRWCGRRGGALAFATIIDDPELSAVLIIACGVDDDLDPVMAHVVLQRRRRRPAVTTGVRDAVDDAEEIDRVGGRASKEHEGDGARGGVLPCDVVGHADGHFGGGAWSVDGVATGLLRDVGFVLAAGSLGADKACEGCRRDGEAEDWGEHRFFRIQTLLVGFEAGS